MGAQLRAELPELAIWSQQVKRAVQSSSAPCIIVAHSFGCLASLYSSIEGLPNLLGMLLVAPADPQKFAVAAEMRNVTLSIPSLVIGSTNDPWMSGESAACWAQHWQAQFVSAGACGHINADSALADWPFGLTQLAHLLEQCEESCLDLS